MCTISFDPHKLNVFSFYSSDNKAQKSKVIHSRPRKCYMDLNPGFIEASHPEPLLIEWWDWNAMGNVFCTQES